MLPHVRGSLVVFVLAAIAVGTGAAAVGIRSVSAADLHRALLVPILTGLFLGGVILVLQRPRYALTYWIAFVVATMVVALDTSRAHLETFLVSFAWMLYWIRSKRAPFRLAVSDQEASARDAHGSPRRAGLDASSGTTSV